MRILKPLFDQNAEWSRKMREHEPEFFTRLTEQQAPAYLWIGCSDSRVPANEIVGLLPGELFVHRNVANLVIHTDLNCLSVLQYAVEVLRVRHVIVCGHYGCGGVHAAASNTRLGLIDNWIRHVRDIQQKHAEHLDEIFEPDQRLRRLCELNVIEQVMNVSQTTVIQDAWERGQSVSVHGWIYALRDGLLRDLGMGSSNPSELARCYDEALGRPAKWGNSVG